MKHTNDGGSEDFDVLLAECHEALVAGCSLPLETDQDIAAATRARLRQNIDCLQRLERLRRQSSAVGQADSTPPGTEVRPRVGSGDGFTRLGRFELRRQLGQGGFGRVYLAWDSVLRREVALKVPHLEVSLAPDLRQRFLNEARAAAGLNHPHLVPVHEVGEANGVCYIVSAYCPGSDLAAWLRQHAKPVEERLAAAMVKELADAVHHVHQHGIYHRDIKPSNVLIDPDGARGFTPRLTDFGLAKLPDGGTDLTRSGALLGTASYMAPEQVDGRATGIGPHTDIYGLGAILYELLTGRPPFQGVTREETLSHVRKQPLVPPSRRRPRLCPTLEAICLKCLEKEPRKRYPSAMALADDLGRWMQGLPTVARPPGPLARMGRAVRRHPVLVTLTLACLLAVGLGLAIRHFSHPDRPLWKLEDELAAGRSVELIGETGRPLWWRWRNGVDKGQVSVQSDGTFAVHCWGFGLLELLSDPRQEHYRLRAEVRHEESDPRVAEVGVYCGRREFPGAGGPIHFFTNVAFNDLQSIAIRWDTLFGRGAKLEGHPGRPPRPKGNQVILAPHLYAEWGGEMKWDSRIAGLTPELFQPALRGGKPWRKLEVEVSPAAIRAWWGEDRQEVGGLTQQWVTANTNLMLEEMKRQRPDDRSLDGLDTKLSPRGSLGLLVVNGSASFRRVVVEPLAD